MRNQGSQGPLRLDDSPTRIVTDQEEAASLRNGPVCIPFDTPTHCVEFDSAVLVASAAKSRVDMETKLSDLYFQMAQVMQCPCHLRLYEKGELEISPCPSHHIPCMGCLANKVSRKDCIYRIIVLYAHAYKLYYFYVFTLAVSNGIMAITC